MGEKLTVIDGVKYREVSRKANVGELVKDAWDGEILTINKIREDGRRLYRDNVPISEREYTVLEPVETTLADEEKSVNPDDIRELNLLVDGLTQTVASLTLRVTELERKGRIDSVLVAQERPKVSLRPVLPKTRDEIVEMAKKDVEKLETTQIPFDVPNLDGDNESFYPGECDVVEYVINLEKRTVVALIRYRSGCKSVWARGKSRCAPDDCFNVHIGKAIALRRALGLTVPTEYYEAPQPTDIRVGDIIRTPDGRRYECRYSHKAGSFREAIIDDSREEVSA